MSKSIFVIAYYLYLIYSINTGEGSAFVMLTGMIAELILMVLVYAFIAIYNSEDTLLNLWSVTTGIIPVVLFQYFIAAIISFSLHELPDSELNLVLPLIVFKNRILIMTGVFIVSYILNTYDFIRKKYPFRMIERSFIYQVLLLSATGLTGIIILAMVNNEYKTIILTLLAVSRISFEIIISRRLTNL